MVPHDPNTDKPLVLEPVENPAVQLERLWRAGAPPDLDVFLAERRGLSPTLLAAVLRVEQRERWGIGQRIPAEHYLQRYPHVRGDEDGMIDLVYGEFLLMEKCGPAPHVNDFLNRFPAIAPVLKSQIELHLVLRSASLLEWPTAGPDLASDHLAAAEQSGAVVGPYKLIELIAEGGMGVVFLAKQREPVKRLVALKVLKAGMDSRQVLARFEAERQALALMDHPNIARVLDAGTTPTGRPYFAMELVKGMPITDYCDEHRLTPKDRLELFVQVCQAVQHAHQKGIIHRDLKPSNVMVAPYDGKPVAKVIDFGIAKAIGQPLTEKTLVTGLGAVVGTLEYMSPEQAELNNLDIDTRSDIYSLGVLLYELLTGSTPLTRKRVKEVSLWEVLRLVREEEPTRPSIRLSTTDELPSVAANRGLEPRKLSGLLRGELDWIVMKALEKDLARRYATANGFAADVKRYLAGEAVQAAPPLTSYRLRKLLRRNRGPVLATALLMLALVSGIIGTTWGLIRADDARADAVAEARLKETALEEAHRNKRDADEKLFVSYLDQARAIRLSRRSGQRFESLEVLQRATELAQKLDLPPRHFDALRNGVIASLALPDLHLSGPWLSWSADSWHADFNEAYTLYARTDKRGNCSVRRVADNAELYHLPGHGVPAGVWFSRDGKCLALTHHRTDRPDRGGGRVQLWALEGPKARLICTIENGIGADFCANSRRVGVARADGTIHLFQLPGGEPLGQPLAPDAREPLTGEVAIGLHPSEPLIAVSSTSRSVVQIRDIRTGQVVASLPQPGGVSHIAWNLSGETLAVGRPHPPLLRLYDRATWNIYRTMDAPAAHLAFNRAGDRLAVTQWANGVSLWDVGTGQRLFGGSNAIRARFSRDDKQLAGGTRDGKFGVWQVGDGREYRKLMRQSAPEAVFTSMSLHPNGRLLAASTLDGFGLWDLLTGCELAFIPVDRGGNGVSTVHFEPAGDLLTAGISGLLRWPIRDDPGATGQIVVGLPQYLLPRALSVSQSRDGRVVAVCNRDIGMFHPYAGGWILHADRPGQPIRFDAGADLLLIAVSPDGRWIATRSHTGGKVKIWDARDGRLVKQLGEWAEGELHFSSDSRWLSTAIDGGQLYAVGTWEPTSRVGNASAFAPDNRLMAVPAEAGGIRLIDRATARELARLQDPDDLPLYQPRFASNGTLLIGCLANKCIAVWDLRRVREHLKPRGLDWEWSEFPAATEGKTAAPLRVRVTPRQTVEGLRQEAERLLAVLQKNHSNTNVATELGITHATAGDLLRKQGKRAEAIDHYAKALEYTDQLAGPHPRFLARIQREQYALLHAAGRHSETEGLFQQARAGWEKLAENKQLHSRWELAWFLVVWPDAKQHDARRAIELAEQLVKEAPDVPYYWRALGAAHLRARDRPAAIAALEKATQTGGGGAWEGFFLTMANWQNGDKNEARWWYDRAERHLEQCRDHADIGEILQFQSEAKKLMSVAPVDSAPCEKR